MHPQNTPKVVKIQYITKCSGSEAFFGSDPDYNPEPSTLSSQTMWWLDNVIVDEVLAEVGLFAKITEKYSSRIMLIH